MSPFKVEVSIGSETIVLEGIRPGDKRLHSLIAAASQGEVRITVEANATTAALVGQLKYCPNDWVYDASLTPTHEMVTALKVNVNAMEFSLRILNVFEYAHVEFVWQLCCYTNAELLAQKNFGRKQLREVNAALEHCGLSLGMKQQIDAMRHQFPDLLASNRP